MPQVRKTRRAKAKTVKRPARDAIGNTARDYWERAGRQLGYAERERAKAAALRGKHGLRAARDAHLVSAELYLEQARDLARRGNALDEKDNPLPPKG